MNLIIYLFIFRCRGFCSLLMSLIWILLIGSGDFDGLVSVIGWWCGGCEVCFGIFFFSRSFVSVMRLILCCHFRLDGVFCLIGHLLIHCSEFASINFLTLQYLSQAVHLIFHIRLLISFFTILRSLWSLQCPCFIGELDHSYFIDLLSHLGCFGFNLHEHQTFFSCLCFTSTNLKFLSLLSINILLMSIFTP